MAEEKKLKEEPQNNNVRKDEIEEEQTSEDIKTEDSEKNKKKSPRKPRKETKLEKLSKKLEEISDKHLRLQAEFDNYRRRTLKEKVDLIKSGGETVLINLLQIIDDFDRALDSINEIDENNDAKQGIILIFNKFKEFLKQNNVKEIEALNKEFNCDFHEALTKIPAASEELKGKNVDVIQKGYILNDKVIRFAKVIVGE